MQLSPLPAVVRPSLAVDSIRVKGAEGSKRSGTRIAGPCCLMVHNLERSREKHPEGSVFEHPCLINAFFRAMFTPTIIGK